MKTYKKIFYIIFITGIATLICLDVVSQNGQQVMQSSIYNNKLPLLIIDAGHGGEDGGAVASDGTVEKEINLNIAEQVYSLSLLLGFDSLMTRCSDDALSDKTLSTIRERKMSDINARMKILSEHKEGCLLSIHQNQFADRTCSGMQVFYSENNEMSQPLASSIQSYTINNLQKDNTRKIKPTTDDIYMLKHANNPAVMVECGFMSNENELQNLKNQRYGTKIAMCILFGVLDASNPERNI